MLLLAFIFSVKKNKAIAFSILFFIVNLLLVLQLLPVGSAVIADRYTYIPLIGPFFLAGIFIQQRIEKNNGKIPVLWGTILSIIIIALVILTNRLSATWKNSATLWDRVIKICPGSLAYANRGLVYKDEGKIKEALDMFTKAIDLDKFQTDALINRANILLRQQRYISAIKDYTQCLAVEPDNDLALSNRGGAYLAIGMIDSATVDLDRAIAINPLTKNGYRNRGMLYILTKQYQNAIDDYKKHLTLVQDETGEIWSKIGYAYQQLGEHRKAIDVFSKAINIYENSSYYYLRALSWKQLNEIEKARYDINKAIQLGMEINKDLLNPDLEKLKM
jgi:tetratricopeptide (TPR) repeat protein